MNGMNTSDSQLHIAIVGSGSAAFAAATQATERGARVTLIEAAETIGGTCVNVGCVPSKVMIRGACIAHLQARHGVEGIAPQQPQIDRAKMVEQQQGLVDALRHAKYESILQSHDDISLIHGTARFEDADTLRIQTASGDKSLRADRILLAVGSRPLIPDIPGLASTPYWDSTAALQATRLPDHLVVLGGSVVAVELAQGFARLGSRVTLMARSTLLSRETAAIGESLAQVFADEGITVMPHTVPRSISHNGKMFTLDTGTGVLRADRLLVATGRRSNADTLALDKAGIATTDEGRIIVDDHLRTSLPHVYATGDCCNQPQYVYVAAAAGTRAARNMTGDDVALDLRTLPTVVFTQPQVASVGLSVEQAQAAGLCIQSRTLTLDNVPRAIANLDPTIQHGFITLVADGCSGKILGCQALAAEAGEIIQSAALAIHHGMTTGELAGQLFPYLTMVEGLKLCAQTFHKDVSQLSCCAG